MVDKYNLVFTYYMTNFDSGGEVRQSVTNLQVFNLVVYLFVIESFFSIKFSGQLNLFGFNLSWLGPVLIIIWISTFCYIFKVYLKADADTTPLKKSSPKLNRLTKPSNIDGSALEDMLDSSSVTDKKRVEITKHNE